MDEFLDATTPSDIATARMKQRDGSADDDCVVQKLQSSLWAITQRELFDPLAAQSLASAAPYCGKHVDDGQSAEQMLFGQASPQCSTALSESLLDENIGLSDDSEIDIDMLSEISDCLEYEQMLEEYKEGPVASTADRLNLLDNVQASGDIALTC